MGTRHLIVVVNKEEYKVAQYGQWDGYPSGQGVTIADFIDKSMDINKFREALDDCVYLTNDVCKWG